MTEVDDYNVVGLRIITRPLDEVDIERVHSATHCTSDHNSAEQQKRPKETTCNVIHPTCVQIKRNYRATDKDQRFNQDKQTQAAFLHGISNSVLGH